MSLRSNQKQALGQRSTLIKHVTSMSYKLEPAIWSCDTGQWITWFDRCQLIITSCQISKKYTVNQGCMSLSTYYLEYGCHFARLHRRRRAYALMGFLLFPVWLWGSAWRPFGLRELRYKSLLGCKGLRWFPSKRTHHRFAMKLGMLMLLDKEILKG